jgi:hypothetical protein
MNRGLVVPMATTRSFALTKNESKSENQRVKLLVWMWDLITSIDEAVSVVQQQGRRSATKTSLPTDIRWIKVLEFLRSTN